MMKGMPITTETTDIAITRTKPPCGPQARSPTRNPTPRKTYQSPMMRRPRLILPRRWGSGCSRSLARASVMPCQLARNMTPTRDRPIRRPKTPSDACDPPHTAGLPRRRIAETANHTGHDGPSPSAACPDGRSARCLRHRTWERLSVRCPPVSVYTGERTLLNGVAARPAVTMAKTAAAAAKVIRNPAASATIPATGAQTTITPRFMERMVTFVRA